AKHQVRTLFTIQRVVAAATANGVAAVAAVVKKWVVAVVVDGHENPRIYFVFSYLFNGLGHGACHIPRQMSRRQVCNAGGGVCGCVLRSPTGSCNEASSRLRKANYCSLIGQRRECHRPNCEATIGRSTP